ncbi:MAG: hypothetical protein D6780_06350 [Candidatus Dadabacteria bacterium]|nr:MAG: hypothetical protein D6780_06350 [Candidatus Dadabacteria bacterium]
MRRFIVKAFLIFLVITPAYSFGIDLNQDSLDELYFYSASKKAVEVYTSSQEHLAEISLAPYLDNTTPILLIGKVESTPLVALITPGSKKKKTVIDLITPSGRVKSYQAKAKKLIVALADIDRNNQSDLVIITKKKLVTIHYNPLTNETISSFKTKALKKKLVTVTPLNNTSYLAAFDVTKSKRRRKKGGVYLINLSAPSDVSLIKKRYPLAQLPQPSSIEGHVLGVEKEENGRVIYRYIDLLGKRSTRFWAPSTTQILAGRFTSDAPANPILAISNSSGTVVDAFSAENALKELDLSQIIGDDTFSGPGPGGSPPGSQPQESCLDNPQINSALNRLRQAISSGDFFQISSILATLQGLVANCPPEEQSAILAQINEILAGQPAVLSSLSNSFFLSATVFAADDPSVGKLKAGCDKIQDSHDGPNGFLLKASDKNGNLVVLLPAGIYTQTAWLVRPNGKGKPIEKLQGSGYSNGFRATLRARRPPVSYPRHLIVKAQIGTKPNAQYLCWEVKNSHVRND